MERDGDLVLNVSCSASHTQPGTVHRLPARMPDGSRISSNPKLVKKITKSHIPATSSGTVFIPRHKLPVLDEFGLTQPSDYVGSAPRQPKMLASNNYGEQETAMARKLKYEPMLPTTKPQQQSKQGAHTNGLPKQPANVQQENNRQNVRYEDLHGPKEAKPKSILKPGEGGEATGSAKTIKRRKRKQRVEEARIIPKEVQALGGGLPPSFPQHRIKKFTEEYQEKKRKRLEEGLEDGVEAKKKRRSFVPGLNPRKREKAKNVFAELTLEDLQELHPFLRSNLQQNMNIKRLTKIQCMVMPELLQAGYKAKNTEFIINSGIGTGKILSYVVPIINNLALMEPKIDRQAGIYALVLLPTRELATKVNDIFVSLCRTFLWVVPGLLTGGERKKSEKARLRKGLNILITTPGRLIDHMEHSKNMDFRKLKYCVLGDAHRLLDPERAEVAKQIAIVLRKRLPRDCIKCVVTATLTKKLEKLIDIVLTSGKPVTLDAFKEFE